MFFVLFLKNAFLMITTQQKVRKISDLLMSPFSSFLIDHPCILPKVEDGCEVQQPKRSDIFSQQDEDKSPKTPLHNTNGKMDELNKIKTIKKEKCEYLLNFVWMYFRTFVIILM